MNPYRQYMYSYPHKTAYGPLEGVRLEEYISRLEGEDNGLYLHIPFCQAKCGYCNLFSVTDGKEEIDRYLDAVERQAKQYAKLLDSCQCKFSSLTIGGGTPLLLKEKQLDRLFRLINQYFSFSSAREIIIETAPNQTTEEKLKLLKEAGVTRVSMGIQSFSEVELKTLLRGHGAKQAKKALDLLMSFAFPCVNVDFIYGIPGQDEKSLLYSLEEAVSFNVDELFLYPLYLKHGAVLERRIKRGEVVLEPEKAYAQYQRGAKWLKASGFRQDSMRRFVRKSGEREFSVCGFGTSLAIGCGGRSYLGNLHFCTPYAITQENCREQLKEFIQTDDFANITHGIFLSEDEQKRRYLIRHLLIYPGLKENRYQQDFSSSVREDFPILNEWEKSGYLMYGGQGSVFLQLTETGLGLSDYLGPYLISPEIERRMREWEDLHG